MSIVFLIITLRKKESQVTNFILYDLEAFHTNRAVAYCVSLYQLSIIASKYYRDLTNEEYRKCKKDIFVFDGIDCISKMLDWLVTLKGEPKKVKKNC